MEIRSRKELPQLLKHFNLPLIAAEIGVAGGHNATDLIKAGLEKIYCVDSWLGDESVPQEIQNRNYLMTVKNLSQFNASRYVILFGDSSKMHKHIDDNSLGLVYIDGAHDYESVKADIENYKSKLVEHGLFSFHDYVNIDGVRNAVNEFADANNLDVYIIPESNRGDAGCWLRI